MYRLITILTFFLSYNAYAQEQAGGKFPRYRVSSGIHSGTYSDQSKNDAEEEPVNLEDIDLKGQSFSASALFGSYDLEMDVRLLFPKQDYWSRRSEYRLNIAYCWPSFVYVQPVFGYSQIHQSGDRDHANAPSAFIQRNRVVTFGLRTAFVPYMFNAVHGTLFQAQATYFTSLEKKSNFGTEFSAALGYLYVMQGRRIGLTLGQTTSFFNGTVEDKETPGNYLHVRHEYVLPTLGFSFEVL